MIGRDNLISKFLKKLDNPLKFFFVTLIIGIQISLLLIYWYSIYRNKLIAGEGIRDTLSYQGKITNTDGVPPPDGLYNMVFKVYDRSRDTLEDPVGNILWTEVWDGTTNGKDGTTDPPNQVAASKVQITEGIFSVELNSLCRNWVGDCADNGGVTFQLDSFYLQMEFDFDANGSYEEVFLPRKRFTATPYAMNADKLDGRESAEFLLKEGDTMTGNLNVPQVNADKITDSSLVAFYQFNRDTKDSTANQLDGTLQNYEAEEQSVQNDVLNLDGADQYVSVTDNDSLSFADEITDLTFTISSWINLTEAANFPIISKGTFNVDAEYSLSVNEADKLILRLYDENIDDCYVGRYYDTALTDYQGQWINIVTTYDGTQSAGIKFYLNGNEVVTLASESNSISYERMRNSAASLFLGRYDTNYAKGQIDDLRVYNRVLTADEIKSSYATASHSPGNILSAQQLILSGVKDGERQAGNLIWDAAHSRFKFDSEVFAPNTIPYFNNSISDRDYSYLADANKILAYDFHESVGTTVNDLAGTATNGTLNGNADWTNLGYIGYGLKFDGKEDYVEFTDPGLATNKGTIELWAKFNDITTSATQYLVHLGSGSSNDLAIYKKNASDLYLMVGDSGEVDTGITISDTSWHHYVLAWDDGIIKFYLDGVKHNITTTYSNLTVSGFSQYYLGAQTTTDNSLNGILDSSAIYTDVLTEVEIKNHYNASFHNIYIANNLSDGNNQTSLANLLEYQGSLQGKYNILDPVYFSENKTLALAFSEGQGNMTSSNDGNNFQAEMNNTKWVKGYYGSGLEFTGNSYLMIPDNNALEFGTDDISFHFWLKCNPGEVVDGARIFSKRIGDKGYEVYFNVYNDGSEHQRLKAFIGDGTSSTFISANSNNDICTGQWRNVLISFDRLNNNSSNRKYYFYLDGTFDSWPPGELMTTVPTDLSNDGNLYIGASYNTTSEETENHFSGNLDSLIFYDINSTDEGRQYNLPNFYDAAGFGTNAPSSFYSMTRSASGGTSNFNVANLGRSGYAAVFALLNQYNVDDSVLQLLNYSYHVEDSNNIYNLINFATINNDLFSKRNFGNLQWDDTNSRFLFDQNLKVDGDLEIDYWKTIGTDSADNEFLAFDVVRQTIVTDDVTNGYVDINWSKAITAKVANLHAICLDANDTYTSVSADDWTNSDKFDLALSYNGSQIRALKQNGTWEEGDIVTVFISYEK